VPKATIEHLPLDLASFASVHAFADTFNLRFDRLAVMVAVEVLQEPLRRPDEHLVLRTARKMHGNVGVRQIPQFMVRRERFGRGDLIVREGDAANRFYLIESGVAEATQSSSGGETHVTTMDAGDFFGEVGMIETGTRTASVRAALLGLPGALAYKAVNTADSMIGHKTDRYIDFGWAAARTDDAVNWPAARLAVLWLALGAFLVPRASPGQALAVAWRDAGKHDSPNAGWPEAAMAGALGLRLVGPSSYEGEIVQKGWMGDGRSGLKAADIRTALDLYRAACGVQLGLLAILLGFTFL